MTGQAAFALPGHAMQEAIAARRMGKVRCAVLMAASILVVASVNNKATPLRMALLLACCYQMTLNVPLTLVMTLLLASASGKLVKST